MKLLNIEKFFLKSNCCNTNNEDSITLVRTIPNKPDPQQYFKYYFNKKCTIDAPTITIGNVKYGKLSAKEQYIEIVKEIKQCYPYHGNTKYMFYFEFTKSGVIHAHGAIIDGYQSRFIDHFNKFGTRNTNNDSYQQVKTIDYFNYIQKDQEKMIKYKMIHNIKKQDMKSLSDKQLSEAAPIT